MSLNLARKGLGELTGPRAEAGAEPCGIRGFGGNLGAFKTGLSGKQQPLHPSGFAVPPKHGRSRRGSPWGRCPIITRNCSRKRCCVGQGGSRACPLGWLRQLPRRMALGGLGLTCPSGPGTTTGPASVSPSLPLALRQPVFPSPGTPLLSLQAVPSCAGCPGVPRAVPSCAGAQVSPQAVPVPRCPAGSAQLLSADVGPRPGNRIECQASSPCTAAAAGGQAALRAHSPFIHGKK